jgi:hypothetical protein
VEQEQEESAAHSFFIYFFLSFLFLAVHSQREAQVLPLSFLPSTSFGSVVLSFLSFFGLDSTFSFAPSFFSRRRRRRRRRRRLHRGARRLRLALPSRRCRRRSGASRGSSAQRRRSCTRREIERNRERKKERERETVCLLFSRWLARSLAAPSVAAVPGHPVSLTVSVRVFERSLDSND